MNPAANFASPLVKPLLAYKMPPVLQRFKQRAPKVRLVTTVAQLLQHP